MGIKHACMKHACKRKDMHMQKFERTGSPKP
jgi:hypothetical protein